MSSTLTIEDYLAITDLKAQYFQHLDAKRWDRLRKIFSDDARFEGFAFDSGGGPDKFVEIVSAFLAEVRSQHQGFMPRFQRIDQHTVRGIWSMHDYLTWAPDALEYKGHTIPGMHGLRGYGYYEDEYSLTKSGWRISFCRLTRTRIDALVGELPVTPNYDVHSPSSDWLNSTT